MLQLLKNFRTVFLGIETPNEDALKETKKTQNLRGHNRSIPEKGRLHSSSWN